MAHVVLNPVRASNAGATVTPAAPTAAGDSLPPGCALVVENTSGASINVTIQTGGTVEGLAIADVVVAVPAAGVRVIGPFTPRSVFVQPPGADAGRVLVDYSAVAGVKRYAVEIV